MFSVASLVRWRCSTDSDARAPHARSRALLAAQKLVQLVGRDVAWETAGNERKGFVHRPGLHTRLKRCAQ